MSDIEDNYSASETESDSDAEELNARKTRKPVKSSVMGKQKTTMLLDKDAGSDDAASDSDEDDDDMSIADSKDDDSEIDDEDAEDMDENALLAEVGKGRPNADDDEFQFGFQSDDEGDDPDLEEDDNMQYLQKLDETVREQTIANHHPELVIHNYDEVEAMTTVVRNEHGIISDPLHRTLPFLSKYERTRILGERAKQINDGATPFVKLDTSVIDGYLIALKELEERKLPFIIRRPLNNGGSEYWKLSDLEFI
jgi:DNA-directed RNA polymerase I, II, and III subunit RPABC2